MLHHRFCIIFLRDFKRFRIHDGRLLTTSVVEHNRFKSSRTHDRAESAASCNAGGNAILIEVLNPCRFHPHLTTRTDHRDRNFITIFFDKLRCCGIHAQANNIISPFPFRAVE